MAKKTTISITTKTGDRGQSGLANGQRFSKADMHFEVVGTLDELNSWLGLVVVKLQQIEEKDWSSHTAYLQEIQDTLFYIGAEVAKSPKVNLKKTSLDTLEQSTADLQDSLSDDWHTRFVLPGGTEIGAWLDIARTVCRRAERNLVSLQEKSLDSDQAANPILRKYLNRLSDYLYLLRCFVNDSQGYDEREFVAQK